MIKKSFFSLGLALVFILSSCSPAAPATLPPDLAADKRVVGYYEQEAAGRTYFVRDIPAGKITNINYAFANVSENGECILGNPAADVERVYSAAESVSGADDATNAKAFHGNFNQLLELKARYPYLKVLISIGGYTWSGNFSSAALTDASRQTFVKSCIDLYLKQYKGVFDGIDIDWELPVTGGLVVNVRAEQSVCPALFLARAWK